MPGMHCNERRGHGGSAWSARLIGRTRASADLARARGPTRAGLVRARRYVHLVRRSGPHHTAQGGPWARRRTRRPSGTTRIARPGRLLPALGRVRCAQACHFSSATTLAAEQSRVRYRVRAAPGDRVSFPPPPPFPLARTWSPSRVSDSPFNPAPRNARGLLLPRRREGPGRPPTLLSLPGRLRRATAEERTSTGPWPAVEAGLERGGLGNWPLPGCPGCSLKQGMTIVPVRELLPDRRWSTWGPCGPVLFPSPTPRAGGPAWLVRPEPLGGYTPGAARGQIAEPAESPLLVCDPCPFDLHLPATA